MSIKFTSLAIVVAVSFAVLNSCKKKDADTPSPVTPVTPVVSHGTPTPIGTPVGTSNSATIGISGGTLFSLDGRLEIIIPANALSASTVIGIQPVTNMTPGGSGLGYDLTPNGQQFNLPVTLRYHYDSTDVEGTDIRAFGIAFQKADRIWYSFNNAVLDSTAQTESTTTTHFSLYSLYRKFSIDPASADLEVGKAISIKVRYVGPGVDDDTNDDLNSLVSIVDYGTPANVKWTLNGIGSGNLTDGLISPVNNSISTTYSAPSSTSLMGQNPAIVTAEVSGIALAGASKIYLISKIKVTGINYRLDIVYTGTHVFCSNSTLLVDYTDSASCRVAIDTGSTVIGSVYKNSVGHIIATFDNNGCAGYSTTEGNLLHVTKVNGQIVAGQLYLVVTSDFIQPAFVVNCGVGVVNVPSITFADAEYNMPGFPVDDYSHTVTYDFGGGEELTITATPD